VAHGGAGAGRGRTLTMPKTTTKRRSSAGRRVPVERRRLPAAPLLEAINTHAARRRQPVEELLDDALQDRLRDAARSGTVTVGTAERCCDTLGWHPRMLWGHTYDQTIADHTAHTATPHQARPPRGGRAAAAWTAATPTPAAARLTVAVGTSATRPTEPHTPNRRNAGLEEHRWQATTSPSRSAT
jgi:hypothetical protein